MNVLNVSNYYCGVLYVYKNIILFLNLFYTLFWTQFVFIYFREFVRLIARLGYYHISGRLLLSDLIIWLFMAGYDASWATYASGQDVSVGYLDKYTKQGINLPDEEIK